MYAAVPAAKLPRLVMRIAATALVAIITHLRSGSPRARKSAYVVPNHVARRAERFALHDDVELGKIGTLASIFPDTRGCQRTTSSDPSAADNARRGDETRIERDGSADAIEIALRGKESLDERVGTTTRLGESRS